jgi:hypothetical protein
MIVIFLTFNITIYSYFLYNQQKKDELILTGYLDSVGNLLLQDLKIATTNNSIYSKTFFLFKKFSMFNSNIKENIVKTEPFNSIKIKPYAIYVKNSAEEFIPDLQELREILNKIFPTFISYTIAINNYNIALGEDSNKTFDIRKDYVIDSNTALTIQAGIKEYSDFYLLNKKKLYTNTLIIIIFSCLSCIFFLYCYLKIKTRIEERFETLEDELHQERKINKALLSNKKINRLLNKLFIKKATEMYVKQELGVTSGDEYIIKNISPSNYLFPMCLYDSSSEKINIVNLIESLEGYFLPYFITTAIKIKTTVDMVHINCTTEVFYQLIFSIIFNLIEFMDRQSEIPKTMVINFTEKKVIINYDSFPLDEERMINLSDTIILEYMNIFLLNCRKIFKSLKEHKFEYSISSENEQNIVEIIYPIALNDTEQKEGQVLDFDKYTHH